MSANDTRERRRQGEQYQLEREQSENKKQVHTTEGSTEEANRRNNTRKKIIIRSARLARAEEERRVSKKAWLIDSISISVNSEPIHVMSCGLTRGGPVQVFLFFCSCIGGTSQQWHERASGNEWMKENQFSRFLGNRSKWAPRALARASLTNTSSHWVTQCLWFCHSFKEKEHQWASGARSLAHAHTQITGSQSEGWQGRIVLVCRYN